MKNKKRLIIVILVYLVVASLTTLLIYLFKDPSFYNNFIRLSDAFLLPGIIYLVLGLFGVISYYGTFDTLSYSIGNLIASFRKDYVKEYADLYEYKLKKAEKRKSRLPYRVFPSLGIGAIFVVISIVFTLLSH